MLPEGARPAPGSAGHKHESDHQFETHEGIWEASTSDGLKFCANNKASKHPTARCAGSLESPGVSPVVLQGTIQGDLLYRNVPRDRLPADLHSRTQSEYSSPNMPQGSVFEPLQWIHLERRICRLPAREEMQAVFAMERGAPLALLVPLYLPAAVSGLVACPVILCQVGNYPGTREHTLSEHGVLSTDPDYADFDNTETRPFEPRRAVTQTISFLASSLDECKLEVRARVPPHVNIQGQASTLRPTDYPLHPKTHTPHTTHHTQHPRRWQQSGRQAVG
jgi:hypothetical protein